MSWARSGGEIKLDHRIIDKTQEARYILENEARHRKIYGYHTRLGRLYDAETRWMPHHEITVLEEHAMGTGGLHGPITGRVFMVVWLTQLTRGAAPVSGATLQRLVEPIKCGYSPAIPAYGSVGASGDLAPASHVALQLLYGRGKIWSPEGELVHSSQMFEECGLTVHELKRGEALTIINTTAYSTTLLLLSTYALETMNRYSLETVSLIYKCVKGNCEHIDESLAELKKHPGISRALKELASKCDWEPRRLQDPYSIRCSPILLGAVYDQVEHAYQIARREYCSTSTNPVITNGTVRHACLFHAIYPALTMDALSPAIALLANQAERRASQLMDTNITGLPPFLAGPESSVGLMITHYTMAALASETRAESMPRSPNNIPTSLLQEDIVSMAPNAGIRLARQLWLLSEILAAERAIVLAAFNGQDAREARKTWQTHATTLRREALIGMEPGLFA